MSLNIHAEKGGNYTMDYTTKSFRELIQIAFNFVNEQYGLDWILEGGEGRSYSYAINTGKNVFNVNISFHPGSTKRCSCYKAWRKYFVPEEGRGGYTKKAKLRIRYDRKCWNIYRRKTVGIFVPGTRMNPKERIVVSLVHEFTHLFERELYWKGGEVQTTLNELKFVYRNMYNYFKEGAEVIIDNRKKPNYNKHSYDGIKCVI